MGFGIIHPMNLSSDKYFLKQSPGVFNENKWRDLLSEKEHVILEKDHIINEKSNVIQSQKARIALFAYSRPSWTLIGGHYEHLFLSIVNT